MHMFMKFHQSISSNEEVKVGTRKLYGMDISNTIWPLRVQCGGIDISINFEKDVYCVLYKYDIWIYS